MPWIVGLGRSQPSSRGEFQEKLWERFRGLSEFFRNFFRKVLAVLGVWPNMGGGSGFDLAIPIWTVLSVWGFSSFLGLCHSEDDLTGQECQCHSSIMFFNMFWSSLSWKQDKTSEAPKYGSGHMWDLAWRKGPCMKQRAWRKHGLCDKRLAEACPPKHCKIHSRRDAPKVAILEALCTPNAPGRSTMRPPEALLQQNPTCQSPHFSGHKKGRSQSCWCPERLKPTKISPAPSQLRPRQSKNKMLKSLGIWYPTR